ncbi:hypothetical protein Ddye_001210 [Dipteronia dyeriana]|uniref:Reverse transcriptase zinc-binding domain-containing protein n=1 Tax=Dipteronia dyeriana TaxID=168575 RepID=A0AAE0CTA2_9ROSI|nr:hypothetical protein Ddye_001210 [Dipteronia dyeriana]
MPIGVANKIEKLQCSFLWRDGIEKKKIHAVDWASVCKSKTSGGLGIGRMVDKNISLLAKWVWRFNFERDSLWKKVVCAKYGIGANTLSWDWKSSDASSFFIKTVLKVINPSTNSGQILLQGIQAVVGKGSNIILWQDVVNDGFQLKVAFLRIFVLAVNQEGFISELGKWIQLKWEWVVTLRGDPFDYEVNQWNCFKKCLEGIMVWKDIEDTVAWKFSSSGLFFVSSFRNKLEDFTGCLTSNFSLPWKGLCPPKIELFTWQLLKGRVLVTDVLQKFGMGVDGFC